MLCEECKDKNVCMVKPSNKAKLCKECFIECFEEEVHTTILKKNMFEENDKICIAVSGGKDSSVLAHVLVHIKKKYNYKWTLFLLAIDEGIKGYRDDSLKVVYKLEKLYNIPLKILKFEDIFLYTMDDVVNFIGKKNNCTVCGVFRRQAMEKGALLFNATKLVTGHNADDLAETILMNMCRGDIDKLAKNITSFSTPFFSPFSGNMAVHEKLNVQESSLNNINEDANEENGKTFTHCMDRICTEKEENTEGECIADGRTKKRCKGGVSGSSSIYRSNSSSCSHSSGRDTYANTAEEICEKRNDMRREESREEPIDKAPKKERIFFLPRLKPLMWSYEKEIVLYAFHLKLDYFSTECTYSPNSFRGNLRSFIKDIETVNPQFILNIIHSSEFFYIHTDKKKKKKLLQVCVKCGVYTSNQICKACLIVEGLKNYTDNSFLYGNKKNSKKRISIKYEGGEA
ncbi:PP-loop family protein, putative [Plasmodium malariae]|uniref:Cytoplasmic tRNA 2-thiolation protein 1 n=1 Tax=Plasmodium malariae TaxID=5858 RepID=A0A1A8W342_PLAMA|nr:PP-loop family protein, putative [Plasmodium malariae]